MKIALATCAEFAELEPDDRLLLGALAEAEAEAVVWDDPGVRWEAYDLVVVRSTWDYTERLDDFLGWADRLGARLANPPEVIRWNTDKRYLADLAAARLPVVPTRFLTPADPPAAVLVDRCDVPCVVKPVVSAGARDTARHEHPTAAAEHAQALLGAGRTVMLQPYLDGVEQTGETALMYFEGVYDHSIRKGPLLLGGAAAVEGLFAPEQIAAREPGAAEREVADRVVAHVAERFGGPLLYARVDLLPAPGGPAVLELELTEPSLFLAKSDGAADRLAAAIRLRAARSS